MRGLKSGYIQLGAQRVEVRVVHKLWEQEHIYGDSRARDNIIRLAGDVAQTQAIDTLLHEVVHCLLDGALSDKNIECAAGLLGRGLASMFRDNPEWVKLILKTFREEAN